MIENYFENKFLYQSPWTIARYLLEKKDHCFEICQNLHFKCFLELKIKVVLWICEGVCWTASLVRRTPTASHRLRPQMGKCHSVFERHSSVVDRFVQKIRALNLISALLEISWRTGRWSVVQGVPKGTDTELTVRTCLEEIDRCIEYNKAPYFINLTWYVWSCDWSCDSRISLSSVTV